MWPIADRKFELNRGELQFARDSNSLWKYATSTISGQAIDFPSDFVESYYLVVNCVVVTNDYEVALADYERYADAGDYYYYVWVNASGTRQMIFLDSSVNTTTYKWWYFGKPTTDLSADGDESVFRDEYREASVYYAAAELLEQIGKTQLSDRYRSKFQFFVDKASDESKKHFINKEYARPDIALGHQFDKDVQGIGQVN